MRNLLILSLLFIAACKDKATTADNTSTSEAQAGIQSIVDSFRLEYLNTTSEILRDSTIDRYNRKLFDFLSTNYIDSIRVHVDTVINQDFSVTTKFHSNEDIAFQYTMNFKREMNTRWDSIYNFMRNLRVGSDTVINFTYMGSHQLLDPSDKNEPTVKIFAFPVPKLHRQE